MRLFLCHSKSQKWGPSDWYWGLRFEFCVGKSEGMALGAPEGLPLGWSWETQLVWSPLALWSS